MALQFVTRQLADSIITTAKLGAASVTTAKLASSSVTADILADDSVDTAAIVDSNVTTAKLAANAVTAAKADLTGTWAFTSGVLRAAAPSADNDVATKSYVDGVAQGIKWKQPARVMAFGNVDISSGLAAGSTIDGVTLVAGDRVLLVGQTTGSQNGVYVASASGAASRAADLDAGSEFPSAAIFVSAGTSYADSGWTCTNDTVTLGSTAITFVQFTGLGSIVAGAGLTKTGNTLDVNVGSGIQITADAVAVKLEANKGLSVGASGIAVLVANGVQLDGAGNVAIKLNATNPGLVADVNGLAAKLKSNGGILVDANGLYVSVASGVQVDGSGNVALLLDGGTLAVSGSGVKVADGGVGTTQLAADSVTLAKAAFRPYAQSFTGGTALAYDLSQDIRAEFYPGVLVSFNGQLLAKVASNPGDGEFVVDRNSGTSKTRITLGGTAPSASDTITANYLG